MTENNIKIVVGSESDKYTKNLITRKEYPEYSLVVSEKLESSENCNFLNKNYLDSISNILLSYRRAVRLVTSKAPFVIINLISSEHLDAYLLLAKAHDYNIEIIQL